MLWCGARAYHQMMCLWTKLVRVVHSSVPGVDRVPSAVDTLWTSKPEHVAGLADRARTRAVQPDIGICRPTANFEQPC